MSLVSKFKKNSQKNQRKESKNQKGSIGELEENLKRHNEEYRKYNEEIKNQIKNSREDSEKFLNELEAIYQEHLKESIKKESIKEVMENFNKLVEEKKKQIEPVENAEILQSDKNESKNIKAHIDINDSKIKEENEDRIIIKLIMKVYVYKEIKEQVKLYLEASKEGKKEEVHNELFSKEQLELVTKNEEVKKLLNSAIIFSDNKEMITQKVFKIHETKEYKNYDNTLGRLVREKQKEFNARMPIKDSNLINSVNDYLNSKELKKQDTKGRFSVIKNYLKNANNEMIEEYYNPIKQKLEECKNYTPQELYDKEEREYEDYLR